MGISWIFKEIERGIPERNPRETEFFRITSPGEALVREFIQNSMDARKNQETVKVKITYNSTHKKNVNTFIDKELNDHLIACDLIKAEKNSEDVTFLVLEDFNTTGLDGSYDPDNRDGNFYNFWWREGISEKRGERAGRWGLGKITYHIVSKIRTFWGFTIRDDGKTLLMGKALLKTHSIDGKRYHYFAYFSQDNFMPIEDNSILLNFKKVFGIKRNNDETGLSVVIPYPVDEINFESIMKGVIRHYYYPLLTKKLEVEIYDGINNRLEKLNNENLIEKAESINWDNTEWEEIDLKKIFELIKESFNISPLELKILEPENPSITVESFEEIERIKESFLSGNLLQFKVPITIKKVNKSENSHIIILIKHFPEFRKSFEAYIRSGILISDLKILGNRAVAGFLVADDTKICEFLGDCETPAHTNWNERTEGFTEKYLNAIRILRFIKKSMLHIVSILDEPPKYRQEDFLKDIFFIPSDLGEKDEQESTVLPRVPDGIQRDVMIFNIDTIQGGFKVTLNPNRKDLVYPFPATLKVAYDTRRKNPFKAYDKFDFNFVDGSIKIETNDCNILEVKENILRVEITGKNFELKAIGFDPKRDLVIDLK